MSQFEGSKVKVRCTDCSKLSGIHCIAKNTTVSPKKKRVCSTYVFKGEYENRIPAAAIYMPHIDKKTKKMIKRLLDMGVVPVAEDGSVEVQDGFARTKSLTMPVSTATSTLVETKTAEDLSIHHTLSRAGGNTDVTYKSTENSDESEDNRS